MYQQMGYSDLVADDVAVSVQLWMTLYVTTDAVLNSPCSKSPSAGYLELAKAVVITSTTTRQLIWSECECLFLVRCATPPFCRTLGIRLDSG